MPTGYQVIARKWRSQTFDDVVGQDHVVRTLKNAITRGRIAHAYLFVGPRGTGKTSLARLFAKALNCTGGPKADFDVNDPACIAIAEGSHLDVIEIDGASNNGVDQVRDLRDTVRYAPAQGKFKVYIIDEVHMLSVQAFNALLKTLEEPPEHVKFVFATTEPQKVLPTIVSRCQRFDLRPIPPALIVERLAKIAKAEKIKITPEALSCIARLADGGMRDAQSILDQMISFCGGEISEPDVLDVYGLVAAEKITALAAALAAGDHKKIVAIVDECDADGRDLVRLLSDLQALVRAALLDAIAQGGKSSILGGRGVDDDRADHPHARRPARGRGRGEAGPRGKDQFRGDAAESRRGQPRPCDRQPHPRIERARRRIPDRRGRRQRKKKGLIDRLEARLSAALQGGNGSGAMGDPPSPGFGAASGAVKPTASEVPDEGLMEMAGEPAASNWPDESAEAAFRSDSRERGEPELPAGLIVEATEETDTKGLPALEDLVKRISPEARELLDELFRAKFTGVKRVPAKALKT